MAAQVPLDDGEIPRMDGIQQDGTDNANGLNAVANHALCKNIGNIVFFGYNLLHPAPQFGAYITRSIQYPRNGRGRNVGLFCNVDDRQIVYHHSYDSNCPHFQF